MESTTIEFLLLAVPKLLKRRIVQPRQFKLTFADIHDSPVFPVIVFRVLSYKTVTEYLNYYPEVVPGK